MRITLYGIVFICTYHFIFMNNTSISSSIYGKIDGNNIHEFVLKNKNGVEVHIIEYGAIITKIITPDQQGIDKDIVNGFSSLDGYLGEHPYFGAIIGRYGNRIGNASFSIDGTEYQLAANNDGNSLHGGIKGFDKQIWKGKILDNQKGVSMSYTSSHMEEGFPGNLSVTVLYSLTDDNELVIDYKASTDKPTVINLTNHSYFNLKGEGEGDILDHELSLFANRITPVNESLIPTGEFMELKQSPFDFRKPQLIGDRIDDLSNQQVMFGGGYDHNFVLSDKSSSLKRVALVSERTTGRVLEVHTTEPGVQLYTGNFLDGSLIGKSGKPYNKRSAFCLETQHYPDSPNQPNFPSTRLNPGEEYQSQTIYKFGIIDH